MISRSGNFMHYAYTVLTQPDQQALHLRNGDSQYDSGRAPFGDRKHFRQNLKGRRSRSDISTEPICHLQPHSGWGSDTWLCRATTLFNLSDMS